jgi:hypothetical protein
MNRWQLLGGAVACLKVQNVSDNYLPVSPTERLQCQFPLIKRTVRLRPIFSQAVCLAERAPRSARGARCSYFRAFSQGESIVDVYSKVAYRVLHFAVPKQYLHSTKVPCRFVD